MSLSMYQASVPVIRRALTSLGGILDKGAAHAEAKKIDGTVLTGARLFPDMFPLARQVWIASDTAKGAVARLAGVDVPKYEDTEQTFAELKARIDKTVAFVSSFTAEQIDGSEEHKILLPTRGAPLEFTGQSYLLGFVLPNLYFHIATAYNILRTNGVELGKMDFLGKP